MKRIIIALFCLFTNTSQADFIEAQKNYDSGNYQPAFEEFITLAKLGNIKSQYNMCNDKKTQKK